MALKFPNPRFCQYACQYIISITTGLYLTSHFFLAFQKKVKASDLCLQNLKLLQKSREYTRFWKVAHLKDWRCVSKYLDVKHYKLGQLENIQKMQRYLFQKKDLPKNLREEFRILKHGNLHYLHPSHSSVLFIHG